MGTLPPTTTATTLEKPAAGGKNRKSLLSEAGLANGEKFSQDSGLLL